MQKTKNKNAVLFQLLEVHHLLKVKSINPNILYRKYMAYCKLYLSKKGVKDLNIPNEIKDLIQTHFKELSEGFCKDTDLDELIKNLNKSILELSESYPIMAFEISDIDRVKMIFKIQQNYSDKFITLLQQEENQDLLEPLIKQLDDAYQISLDEIFSYINEKIKIVSATCGKKDSEAVKKIMLRNPTNHIDFEESDLNEFLEKVFLQFFNKEPTETVV